MRHSFLAGLEHYQCPSDSSSTGVPPLILHHMEDAVIKIQSGHSRPRPVIQTPTGDVVGFLSPLNVRMLDDAPLMDLMTRWRIRHAYAFASTFSPTVERTRAWLRDTVLTDSRRLLFLINHAERPIGHIGFRDLTPEGYQGDNLVRGERGGGINFMQYAAWAFHAWAMQHFGVSRTWGRVLASNASAIHFNLTLGHTIDRRVPCFSRIVDGGVVLDEHPCQADEKPADEFVYVSLTWDNLLRAAPAATLRADLQDSGNSW